MKKYSNINCIEGEYFSCPTTTSTINEEPKNKVDYERLAIDEQHYKKSYIRKKIYKLIEKDH